jgi:hypothetical protein
MPHRSQINLSTGTIPSKFRDGTLVAATVQTITDLGFTNAEIDKARRAVIGCHVAPVVVRWDGGIPADNLGYSIKAGNAGIIVGTENIRRLQFVSTGAAKISLLLES